MSSFVNHYFKNRNSEIAKRWPLLKIEFEIFPAAMPYFTHFPKVFGLAERFTDLALLQKQKGPVLLVRDGATGVATFFQAHPRPQAKTPRLIIEQSLCHLTPATWSPQVLYYKVKRFKHASEPLQANRGHRAHPINQLAICGTLPEGANINVSTQAAYKRLITAYNSLSTKAGQHHQLQHHQLALNTFLRNLGDARIPRSSRWEKYHRTFIDFFTDSVLANSLCLNLTDRKIIIDDYYTHRALSLGATVIGVPEASAAEMTLRLSPYHGMEILNQRGEHVQI